MHKCRVNKPTSRFDSGCRERPWSAMLPLCWARESAGGLYMTIILVCCLAEPQAPCTSEALSLSTTHIRRADNKSMGHSTVVDWHSSCQLLIGNLAASALESGIALKLVQSHEVGTRMLTSKRFGSGHRSSVCQRSNIGSNPSALPSTVFTHNSRPT